MGTSPSGDAKERDIGGAGPKGLEGRCAPSKQLGFCPGDLVEKSFEVCTRLSASLRSGQQQGRKRSNANNKGRPRSDVCPLHLSPHFAKERASTAPELSCGASCELLSRTAWSRFVCLRPQAKLQPNINIAVDPISLSYEVA
jgi:hypothetical protein